MTTELQNKVWSCLPKEFKEEVKRMWSVEIDCATKYKSELHKHRTDLLYELFGEHLHWQNNLTTDAEGEEMLTVSRKKVQEFYAKCKEVTKNPYSYPDYSHESALSRMALLDILFGSKCLSDELNEDNFTKSEPKKKSVSEISEEISDRVAKVIKAEFAKIVPKPAEPLSQNPPENCDKANRISNDCDAPAEPKFKVGDYVRYNGDVRKVVAITKDGKYFLHAISGSIPESDLEPYTELEEVAKMKPIESKVSVYLATQEEDKEFRQLLHENGFKWSGGHSLIDSSCWESDIQESKIHFVYPDMTVTYCGNKTPATLTFTEFKERYFGDNVNLSQETANCDNQPDNILKDVFSKERRLNIGVQMMQALVCAPPSPGVDPNPPAENLAKTAFRLADALIAEAEKGGER